MPRIPVTPARRSCWSCVCWWLCGLSSAGHLLPSPQAALSVCEGWAGLPLTSKTQLPLVCEGEWDLAVCLYTPTLLKSSWKEGAGDFVCCLPLSMCWCPHLCGGCVWNHDVPWLACIIYLPPSLSPNVNLAARFNTFEDKKVVMIYAGVVSGLSSLWFRKSSRRTEDHIHFCWPLFCALAGWLSWFFRQSCNYKAAKWSAWGSSRIVLDYWEIKNFP